ncbi:tRNA uridine-5-carboxymethylaminomethyl(34) synthesis GTPase MnmE [Polymorphobacter sp. PAMC 29334]|uniref:tRNA uridine-5-carboxymethylaminomethyl(34) synthesis GTPase MnmE n=1 Tax=Polymorphobacter sp. PAMC 29334 TaxID=2862331 RepID=UPI001C745EDB|nr:tRNA uridine-5-carboxymethylaminomethyl(34) synthesis GTPase MnmE [Polymorphobacter sp. PAMC 29334]QYE35717.1 tRNA uridine-5-carboxymethylaminomethyl(34) synthesis GTPase MnmE [Polymorphobacter sp. PAMC 29334]
MTTIFALSSGRPPAGIAIIRISGAASHDALAVLTQREVPQVRQLVRRRLIDRADSSVLDDAMVVAFAAPSSATGDDLVELHLHGGVAVVAAVLGALSRLPGLMLAKPGEFTRRAFDNGKLDLSQVEGLADLIEAETELQRRQALGHVEGFLRDRVDGWRTALIETRADLEASLDFADEDDVPAGLASAARGRLTLLSAELDAAAIDATRGERIRDGLTVAITGPVNSGKSSLVNALAKRDVAIVSEHAGTTRDILEVRLDLGGAAVTLLDTAGLRLTTDPVEAEGVKRAIARAASADLVIVMGGGAARSEDLQIVGKCDLSGRSAGWDAGQVHLSTKTGEGIGTLVAWLTIWANTAVMRAEPALVTRERHRTAVVGAQVDIGNAIMASDSVLAAEYLRGATVQLDSIVGAVTNDDVLDAIFMRFCLGK